MAVAGPSVLIDPSLAMTSGGLDWLEQDSPGGSIAISASFWRLLRTGEISALAAFGEPQQENHVFRLLEALEGVESFSHSAVEIENSDVAFVRNAILESGHPAAPVLADEWVFMQTRSWIAAHRREFASAFQEAGAACMQSSRRAFRFLVARTLRIPGAQLPDVITPTMATRTGLKWLAVGGTPAVALFAPPLGAAAAVVSGIFMLLDP